jgi:hypothetical protein
MFLLKSKTSELLDSLLEENAVKIIEYKAKKIKSEYRYIDSVKSKRIAELREKIMDEEKVEFTDDMAKIWSQRNNMIGL